MQNKSIQSCYQDQISKQNQLQSGQRHHKINLNRQMKSKLNRIYLNDDISRNKIERYASTGEAKRTAENN
jgi:hypothetical protein